MATMFAMSAKELLRWRRLRDRGEKSYVLARILVYGGLMSAANVGSSSLFFHQPIQPTMVAANIVAFTLAALFFAVAIWRVQEMRYRATVHGSELDHS